MPVPPYNEVLPESYWQGLVPPKAAPHSDKIRWGWAKGGLAFILVAGALVWITARSTHLNETGFALGSMGEPNPPSLEAQAPGVLVRRAIALPLAVRRAQLVSPPIGARFDAHMPYGETVRCTYLGNLPSQEALPALGNHIGDMYSIGHCQFVWVAPAGGVAQWIDP
jgi:hypothetical protein